MIELVFRGQLRGPNRERNTLREREREGERERSNGASATNSNINQLRYTQTVWRVLRKTKCPFVHIWESLHMSKINYTSLTH
jgi:hypothetical protein